MSSDGTSIPAASKSQFHPYKFHTLPFNLYPVAFLLQPLVSLFQRIHLFYRALR